MSLGMRTGIPFATFSRSYATRRAVRPPPKVTDPLVSSPNASIQPLPDGLSFIHRPPPTAPTPFSTILQPASPLLRLTESSKSASVVDSSSSSSTPHAESVSVPPRLHKPREFPNNNVLTEADFEQMRQKRASNPEYYTRGRLAKEFNCPPFLVAQKAPLDCRSLKAALGKREAEHESNRSQWGENKSVAKAIRQRRRQFW